MLSTHSFCKIDKKPFYETIFRKSKMDIYKCPFSKISVDFFSRVVRTFYYFLSSKTIKIRPLIGMLLHYQ